MRLASDDLDLLLQPRLLDAWMALIKEDEMKRKDKGIIITKYVNGVKQDDDTNSKKSISKRQKPKDRISMAIRS